MQDWQTWFKNLIAKNYFFTKLTNPDEVSSPIVKAIKEKEVTPQIDPSDISQPIVGAIDDLRKSVEDKEGVEEVTVKNIEQAKADLTEVVSVLKDILNKEEKDIEFPEQKETVIDLAPVITALGKIEKAIPDYKPQQIADYTEILQNLTKVIEAKQPVDLSKIESQLETSFAPLAKTEDMVALAAWLEAIATKPESEEPPFQFENGRLKVQVDRIGGGGSGLTSAESSSLQGVATEATLQTLSDASHAEDSAHVSGDKGIPMWGVRVDAYPPDGGVFGADGDYIPVATNYKGDVKVVPQNLSGASINPATEEKQDPTAPYSISDLDESGTTKYYGFLKDDGAWYIMSVTATAVRYVKGASGYSFASPSSLTYDTFSNTF